MTQFRPSRKLWQKIIYICIYIDFFAGHFIRETLASGLRARMNECGYRLTTATTLQEAGDVASRLKKGDVALWLGIHQERNFMRLAPRLAAKGVYVISYQTDYFPLKAYPGAAETWSSVWKSNFTAPPSDAT